MGGTPVNLIFALDAICDEMKARKGLLGKVIGDWVLKSIQATIRNATTNKYI